MRVQAAVLRAVNEPLSIEDLVLDEPKQGEVLVRLVGSGLCGSDLYFLKGTRPTRMPVVRGHEGSGIVERVGPGVTRFVPGDAVVTTFTYSCGSCYQCLRGRTNHCLRGSAAPAEACMPDGTFRFHSISGESVGTGSRIGGFATHSVMTASNLVHVPAGIDLVAAALLSCGVSTGVGAALSVAQVKPADTVVVFGAGGVGTAAIQGAAIAGAARIVAVDLDESRGARAMTFGATEFVNAAEGNLQRDLSRIVYGHGYDVALITLNDVRGQNIADALEAIGPGGVAVLAGGLDPSVTSIPYPPQQMLLHHKTFRATLGGGVSQAAEIRRCLTLYQSGRLKLDEMVTTRYALADINQAVEDLQHGVNIRGVVTFDGASTSR